MAPRYLENLCIPKITTNVRWLLFKSRWLTARATAERWTTLRHIVTSGYYVAYLKKRTVHTALPLSHTPLPLWGRCEFHLDSDLPFHAPQILNFGSTLSTVHVTCHTAVSFPLPPVTYLSFKMQIPATLTSLLQRNPWRPSESVDWHPLIIGTETWPSDCCYEHAAGGGGGIARCNCSVL